MDSIDPEVSTKQKPSVSFDMMSLDKVNHLLSHWLQCYPGDSRGSTSFATYTQLRTALLNTGLGDIARDLPSYEELISHDRKR